MSESTTTLSRPDQFRASKSGEPFTFDSVEQPEDFLDDTKGIDFTDEHARAAVADAETIVRDAYEQASKEKLVFPDEKRGHFEVDRSERQDVKTNPSMLDDAWREQVEARRAAVSLEAEARAEELEQASAIGANVQAITATRDYVLQYGKDAGVEGAVPKKASLFGKMRKLVTGAEPEPKVAVSRFRKFNQRDLIRTESKVGATVFGAIPANHQREFFALDASTLVWYENYVDESSGQNREVTTRYEVHPHGILKVQDGQAYTVVEGEELRNLAIASRMARERVMREVYGRDPVTGQLLSATPATM
jgi:hypothetical protein